MGHNTALQCLPLRLAAILSQLSYLTGYASAFWPLNHNKQNLHLTDSLPLIIIFKNPGFLNLGASGTRNTSALQSRSGDKEK